VSGRNFIEHLIGVCVLPALRYGAASIPPLFGVKSFFSFYYATDCANKNIVKIPNF
jgi:hypothetical protein